MPFVQVADVNDDLKLNEETKQTISKLAQPMSVYIPKESVIVTLQGTIGKVAITQYNTYLDRTILYFDTYKIGNINKYFWALTIKNKFEEERKKAPGAVIKTITKEVLSEFNLNIPQQDEQEKIGMLFADIDNLITLHQRKYSKELQTWEQRKLEELGTITTGNTPSTAVPEYYSDDGIVWVTPTDIIENITVDSAKKLSKQGQQVGRIVPKNTILVTCIASIGKNTMLGNTGSFNQQINGLTPDENKYDPYFLLTESALWSAKMKSSAAAGTMQIVNRTEFSELKTWLPSLIEQKAIGDFFSRLDNLITLHQHQ